MSYKIENIGQYTIVTDMTAVVSSLMPLYEELTLLTEGKVKNGVLSLRRNDTTVATRSRVDVSSYRTFPSNDMVDGSLVSYSEVQLIAWIRENTGVNTLYAHTHVEADITDLQAYVTADGTVPLTANWDAGAFDITAQGMVADTVQLTGGTGVEGLFQWNIDDGTVDLGMVGGNVTLQLGQEMHAYVKASENITNGDVIYASGSVGASGKLVVTKFIADGTIEDIRVLGMATEDIAINTSGYITVFGAIRGLDTTGTPVGETWLEGDILYASSTVLGGLTNIRPPKPLHGIRVAMVTTVHASNGTVFIRPSIGEHLDDLHDVTLTALTNGEVLKYNSTSEVFENSSIHGDYQIKTAAYTALPTDGVIECDGTFTITF